MKKVYLYRGLPGSGKSTAARQRMDAHPGRYKRVNKDDLRAMLDNKQHSAANEKMVLQLRDHIILVALAEGKHVLVDDTNLHPKHERRIRELVRGQAEVEIVDFMHIDVNTCIERDRMRPHSVGERIIRQMHRQYLQWHQLSPTLEQDRSKPAAIICDLDGTLAIIDHRSPYDASTADRDALNVPVADIIQRFAPTHRILFLSGREDQYRTPTEIFLRKHLGEDFDYTLIMRATGDRRRDADIKQEILERDFLPHFHIDFILDDRNQVVDMWRRLGLTCLQVNYGDF